MRETDKLADPEESFRLLFHRFYGPLFRFFTRRGFKPEECQDLIQETFLKVDRGLSGFREESSWESWIFRIAANTVSNAVRHDNANKRSGEAVAVEIEDVADSLSEAAGGISQTPAPLRQSLSDRSFPIKIVLCWAKASSSSGTTSNTSWKVKGSRRFLSYSSYDSLKHSACTSSALA